METEVGPLLPLSPVRNRCQNPLDLNSSSHTCFESQSADESMHLFELENEVWIWSLFTIQVPIDAYEFMAHFRQITHGTQFEPTDRSTDRHSLRADVIGMSLRIHVETTRHGHRRRPACQLDAPKGTIYNECLKLQCIRARIRFQLQAKHCFRVWCGWIGKSSLLCREMGTSGSSGGGC